MDRFFNFSAGPAILPLDVLRQVRDELLDWQGSGLSVMEMSHRGDAFLSIASKTEADLRALLDIPDDYKVLFLQGGASLQFSMLPLNLLGSKKSANYVVTGYWSKKAVIEASRFCTVNVAADTLSSGGKKAPDIESWKLDVNAAYVHYTANETIDGVEFHRIPETSLMPLVADMSSTLLSRPIDINKFGLIYAGAQKNLGPAGLTLVIIKEDLLGFVQEKVPILLNYQHLADNDSMANTPPTFSWYVAGLVLEWLKKNGGLNAIAEINQRKAEKLYKAIDGSSFYSNTVQADSRSWMNIPFMLAEPALEKLFLKQATEAGLLYLNGHRSVGGMRASLYNAMPEEGVDALIVFMKTFEKNHG